MPTLRRTVLALALLSGCGESNDPPRTEAPPEDEPRNDEQEPAPRPPPAESGASLPNGLLLSYSQFVAGPDGQQQPGPARLEILTREGGEWRTDVIEDPDSNVFHKAMPFDPPEGE